MSGREQTHERIAELLRLAAQLCDAPVATFSCNDRTRERFVGCHGISLEKLPLEKGFADYIVSGSVPLLINDARIDPRFPRAPLIKAFPELRFYAGVPVIDSEGIVRGTLAVMDRIVRHLPQNKLQALATLASQLAIVMDRTELPSEAGSPHGSAPSSPLQAVFDALPGNYWLVEAGADLRIAAVSEVALQTTRMARDEVVGKTMKEVCYSAPGDTESSEGVRQLLASLHRVRKTGRADQLIAKPYAISTAPSHASELHYWTATNVPVHDSDGRLRYIINHSEDVTELVQLKEQQNKAVSERRSLQTRTAKMQADIVSRSRQIERLNEHLRIAQSVARVGSWEIGIEDATRMWSDEVYDILGISANEFSPGEDLLLAMAHPDDRPLLLEQRDVAMRGADAFDLSHRIVLPDGTIRFVRQQARVGRSDKGDAIMLFGTIQDITTQKQLEMELQVRARQQEVVAKLGQKALSGVVLEDLWNEAVRVVAETFDVEYCKVLQLLPDGSAVKLVAGVGWQEGLVGRATVGIERESQAGYTLLSEGPVIVRDLRTETRFNGPPLLHNHGVVSGISVIIAGREGRPWGVLGAHTTRLREFNQDDVNFFESVANIIAEANYRTRIKDEMAMHALHQEGLSRLTRKALQGCSLRELQAVAAQLVTEILGVEYSGVTERLADGSGAKVVAGTGWQKGVVSHAVLGCGKNSQGGFALAAVTPQTITDLPRETRFRPSPMLLEHGIDSSIVVAIQCADGAVGSLCAHTTRRRYFSPAEADFMKAVADVLAEVACKPG